MVRKAGATDKKSKGSQKNETYMAGITDAADIIQENGNDKGKKLDQDIAKSARKPAKEIFE